jgi:hypothetical protein
MRVLSRRGEAPSILFDDGGWYFRIDLGQDDHRAMVVVPLRLPPDSAY